MLEISYIREHQDEIIQKLKIKNFDAENIITEIIACDKDRREIQGFLDNTLAESKKLAKAIGQLYKEGKTDEANKIKEKTAKLKTLSKDYSSQLEEKKNLQNSLLLQLPNIPHPSVKGGNSDADNEIFEDLSDKSVMEETGLPHWELTDKYDIIDFDLGSKITGAGFPVYKGKGARLQRALINFFLDEAIEAGYREIQPPLLINEASGLGTGQLPDKEGQMYEMPLDKLFLIPTAEVPITNIYRDVIVKEQEFPIKNVAYSNCFRREAGSYGKDVRGLNRLHQFDKIEIVQIQHPDKSYDTLNEMVEYVKGLLTKLELPFRVLRLCGGDLSFTSALTFDLEVYSKGQKRWLEVSSVSNFETFQANRMKLRFKDSNGKTRLAHTLNGSALALPRIVAALLENNQTDKGIKIPKVLVPYTKFEYID